VTDIKNERWLPVPEYEGYYEVSSEGRFRSLDRTVTFADGRRRFFAGRPLKLKTSAYGYPLALLSAGMDRKKWVGAHIVVAAAFLGPRPEGMQVCHDDNDRSNPRLSNLRYDTPAGNAFDKIRHGTVLFGMNTPSAKFEDDLVAAIIAESNGTVSEIAAKFGVSRTHAWNVRNGKRRKSRSAALSDLILD